ncbi:MAG: acyl-CoA dehydrogenase family protein [Promethearchaeota archaeon]
MAEEEKKYKPEKAFDVQVIKDDILKQLTLKKRYAFLNNNLMAALETDEMNFLKKVQRFCLKQERKVDHSEDFYDWVPAFGKEGLISRAHKMEMVDLNYSPYGMIADMMRCLAMDFFDPQFNMAAGATVLALNPVHDHHDNVDVRLKALKEMATGVSPGAIMITEPERGSDATRQLTLAERRDDGIVLNGTKIFNTNAPKSNWLVAYGTTEQNNPKTMCQVLIDVKNTDGLTIERVNVPWVPKIFIGKETLKDVFVPNDRVLGDVGRGMAHLFEGLIPERIGIAVLNIAQCWNAVTHAAIYANLREQMGKPFLLHQGAGFVLVDAWAKTTNLTLSLLQFGRSYDEKFEKFGGKIPKMIQGALVASASQLKYHCSILAERLCYEMANLMGGAGVCDNTLMHDLVGISRIQEVVGGTRQIQQYIMSRALRTLWKM